MQAGLRPVVIAATSSPVSVVAPLRTHHYARSTLHPHRYLLLDWTCVNGSNCSSIPAITTSPAAAPRRERPSRLPEAI